MLDEQTLATKFSILVAGRRGMRRLGARNNLKSLRLEQTWHAAPLSRTWMSTVGMWGGIYTPKRILEVSGVKYNTLNQFRFAHSLGTAKNEETCRAAWDVAAGAYSKFETTGIADLTEKVTNVCARQGILPFELYLYVHGVKMMMDALGLGADHLALYETENMARIVEYWDEQKFLIDRAALLTYAEDQRSHGQEVTTAAIHAVPYGEDD